MKATESPLTQRTVLLRSIPSSSYKYISNICSVSRHEIIWDGVGTIGIAVGPPATTNTTQHKESSLGPQTSGISLACAQIVRVPEKAVRSVPGTDAIESCQSKPLPMVNVSIPPSIQSIMEAESTPLPSSNITTDTPPIRLVTMELSDGEGEPNVGGLRSITKHHSTGYAMSFPNTS